MHSLVRDDYIDFIRGLAVISVIFIHTVFWSGLSYTPVWIQNIALMFDVPIFFLMTGCVFGLTGVKEKFLFNQLFKLSINFTIFVILCQFLFWHFSLQRIFDSLFLNKADIPEFIVVEGSYWFVPVYVTSIIIAMTIIKLFPRAVPIILILGYLYYLLRETNLLNIDTTFLGVNFSGFFFYACLILLGWKFYTARTCYVLWWGIIIIAFFSLLAFHITTPDFELQKYKFPLSWKYVSTSMISVSLVFLCKKFKKILINHPISQFLTYIGKNSIDFYISQGIGASLIYRIVPYISFKWGWKCLCMFLLNLAITLAIGCLYKKAKGICCTSIKSYLTKILI